MEYHTSPKKYSLHPTSLFAYSLTPENYSIPSKGNLFLKKSQNFHLPCINGGFQNIDSMNRINIEGFPENTNTAKFPKRCFDAVEVVGNRFSPNRNPYISTLHVSNNDNVLFPSAQKRAFHPNLSGPAVLTTPISPALMTNFQDHRQSESAKLLNRASRKNGEYAYQNKDDRKIQKKLQEMEESKHVEKTKIKKGGWTEHEDSELERLVNLYGCKRWSLIGTELEGRQGKQCRERWNNHLKPGIKKEAWSEEEDIILIQAHRKLGNHWSKMLRWLPGRPENDIKNRWNAAKRRLISMKKPNGVSTSKSTPLMDYIESLDSAGGNVNKAKTKNKTTATRSLSPIGWQQQVATYEPSTEAMIMGDMPTTFNAMGMLYDADINMSSTDPIVNENNLNYSQMPLCIRGYDEQDLAKKGTTVFRDAGGWLPIQLEPLQHETWSSCFDNMMLWGN